MTVFYIDPDGGNDANAGTSFALRWKTLTNGATNARINAGDELRVMASPDPESVGNATWTYGSRTVTLAAAKTQTIHECDAAWTASANVTATASSTCKVGTNSAQLAIATAFTTGKIAYVATGALDLSAYTRVSMLIQSSLAHASGVFQIKLCSDTIGDVAVNTLTVPAITAANTNTWQSIVMDNGGALGSNINSIAIYAVSDPGTPTLRLDNIVAALSAATSGALTHNSLLGKVHNLSWSASTAYALNDIRIPTQTNRNGFCYKVTATTGSGHSGASEPTWPTEIGATVTDGDLTWTRQDEEESWYAIVGLSGTTVLLEAWLAASPSQGRGYSGPTGSETVATYKRECFLTVPETAFSGITDDWVAQDTGNPTAYITISGGWDRTSMASMTGETWFHGQNGLGCPLYINLKSCWIVKNYNGVRFQNGLDHGSAAGARLELYNCHFNQNTSAGITMGGATGLLKMRGVQCNNNGVQGFDCFGAYSDLFAVAANGNSGGGSPACGMEITGDVRINHMWTRRTSGVALSAGNNGQANARVRNWKSVDSSVQALSWSNQVGRIKYDLFNCDLSGETTIVSAADFSPVGRQAGVYSARHNRVADAHYILTWGGTIESATDRRYSASGISWKFKPTVGSTSSSSRDVGNPLRLSVAKIACAAGVPIYVRVMANRDSSNIKGRLMIEGGSLRGVPDDVYSANIEPTLNTWEQSGALVFTPSEAGVAEIFFECWDGSSITTTSQFWIDDITVGTS